MVFTFMGGRGELEGLINYAKDNSSLSNVLFVGNVPLEDMRQYYSKARLPIICCLEGFAEEFVKSVEWGWLFLPKTQRL